MRVLKTLVCLMALNLSANVALADCTPHSLRLAVIPIKSAEDMTREHQPLLQRLSQAAGVPVELVIAASYESVVDAIVSGARTSPGSARLRMCWHTVATRVSSRLPPLP